LKSASNGGFDSTRGLMATGDSRGEVREIYTLSFLQPQVMFNDIKTLALETG
jgi:hypothetical protein